MFMIFLHTMYSRHSSKLKKVTSHFQFFLLLPNNSREKLNLSFKCKLCLHLKYPRNLKLDAFPHNEIVSNFVIFNTNTS